MKRSNEVATTLPADAESENEAVPSEADEKGSSSTQKGNSSSQKGTKKTKVSSSGTTKHAMGYKSEWETEFPWLIPEKNSYAAIVRCIKL